MIARTICAVVLLAAAASDKGADDPALKALLKYINEGKGDPRCIEMTPFPRAEFARFAKPGSCSIDGQAFAPTRGGSVIRFAGREVALLPATPHTVRWIASAGHDSTVAQAMGDLCPDVMPYVRVVTADADGGFRFARLPAGPYFACAQLSWDVLGSTQGGPVFKLVTIRSGKNQLLLTP